MKQTPVKTQNKQLTQAEVLEAQQAAFIRKNKEAAAQVLLGIRAQLSRSNSYISSESRNY